MKGYAQKQSKPQQEASPDISRSSAQPLTTSQTVHQILYLQRTVGNQTVQRLLRAGEATSGTSGPLSRAPDARAATSDGEVNNKNLRGSRAEMTSATLADWLPQTRGTGAENVTVLPSSPTADRGGVNAVTLGRVVHLSSGISRSQPAEQRRVLAHEAVHVAQRSASGPSAPREKLESEARQLSPQVLSGSRVRPQFHADAATALADDGGPLPNDIIAVRKAKARREVLLRYKAIYEGSKTTDRAALITERQNILEKREQLDASMAKRLKESEKFTGKARTVEEYRKEEEKNLAALNKKPITLEVTKDAVRIRARFQVRFEGIAHKEAERKFPVLKRNLEQGVRDIWNQKLKGAVLPGRTLEVLPQLTLVPNTAARDDNFWLITVRPTDQGPMVYGKTNLGKPPDGLPTSVTSSALDGGVMSIPPSHITKPATLGHETLHLFGLADRYVNIPGVGPFGLRDTKGRPDPLGANEVTGDVEGKILEEDLGFVLAHLDVYPTIPYSDVLAELRKVEEIIRTQRDPDSQINKRKHFRDEMIKQAEDLD